VAEGIDAAIKWPNDVVLGGKRKLAGILTEIEAEADRVRGVVVGIGVNLNSRREHFPEELHERATSVWLETGREVDRTVFAARLLAEFEARYHDFLEGGFAAVRPHWERRSALVGRRVEIGGAGTPVAGQCLGIDEEGALLLDVGTGAPHRVLAGDVTIIGGYQ
jgi:BirA family biotin operon repressor/biotin-[acetyl-CoA-carboxylase] ligase